MGGLSIQSEKRPTTSISIISFLLSMFVFEFLRSFFGRPRTEKAAPKMTNDTKPLRVIIVGAGNLRYP